MGFLRPMEVFCVAALTLCTVSNAQQCSTGLKGHIILADAGSIVKVDASGKNREVLTNSVNQAIILDYDYQRNILYWADLETFEIYALDEGASKPRIVVPKQKKWLPFSIAIESTTQKLYVGDGFTSQIRIFDLKNINNEGVILGKGLREIRSLGIDVDAGYLFVIDRHQILRTNLDGSSEKVLYEAESKYANEIEPIDFIREPIPVFRILVDSEAKRLYWVDSIARHVVSSNYEGQDKKIIFKSNEGDPIAESLGSLARLGNYLYWSDFENGVVYKIDIESGSASKILHSETMFIKSISCSNHQVAYNPCEQSNYQCEQLCVLSKESEDNRKCLCNIGYELAKDNKSCTEVRDFVLFTQNGYIQGQSFSVDGEDVVINNAINPSKFPVGSYALIEYNADDGIVYHNGPFPYNHLYQVSLDSGAEIKLEPNLLSKDVLWFAYDWASKNLYYFTFYYADQITLSVLNVQNPTYSKIIVDNVKRLVNGVAVHPHKGYVYFGQNVDEEYARIVRVNSDGSDFKVIVDLGRDIYISGLTIDLESDRLYWNQHEASGKILRNSNLDGGDIVSVNVPELLNFIELAFYKDYMYAINDTQTQLLRLNKKNLNDKIVLINEDYPGTLSGVKIVNSEIQMVKPNHPCIAGKHQCEKFCFVVKDKAVCGCPYGQKLDANGKTCSDNSELEPPFKPCRSTSYKCNKQTE